MRFVVKPWLNRVWNRFFSSKLSPIPGLAVVWAQTALVNTTLNLLTLKSIVRRAISALILWGSSIFGFRRDSEKMENFKSSCDNCVCHNLDVCGRKGYGISNQFNVILWTLVCVFRAACLRLLESWPRQRQFQSSRLVAWNFTTSALPQPRSHKRRCVEKAYSRVIDTYRCIVYLQIDDNVDDVRIVTL